MGILKLFFYSIIILLIMSCGGDESADSSNWNIDIDNINPANNAGDWIFVHELSDTESLNPYTGNDAGGGYIMEGNIFERMLIMDNNTLKYIPWLAESMPEVSNDKLAYTFTLRNDITFSDGMPLTGHDVIFTLKAIKNPFTEAAPQRNYYKDIAKASLVDGDIYKIRFECSEVFFKQRNMIGDLNILPKHIYDPNNFMDDYSFKDLSTLQQAYLDNDVPNLEDEPCFKFAEEFNSHETARHPVGSGPYTLKEWRANDRVILEKNKNYWKQSEEGSKNLVDRIIYKTIKTYEAALTSAKAQEIDALRNLPPKLFYEETGSRKFMQNLNKVKSYYPNYSYIGWNNDHPIFGDKLVRQAMTHLCNREAIIEALYFGDAQIAKGNIYFKRPEFHTGIEPLAFNPEKAKQLLKEAGWSDTDGDGVLDKMIDGKKTPFTFLIKTNQGNDIRKKIALLLIEEVKKIGIEADLQTLEWAIYLDDVRDHKFDAMILGWVFSVLAPDPYQVFHSSQSIARGSNAVSFNHTRADELVELNRKEFNADKRKDYMYEFQEILSAEQPYTFLVCSMSHLVYHKRFKGVNRYPFRPGYDLQEWWVPNSITMYTQ